MPSSKQKSVSSKKMLKTISESLDALDASRRHHDKAIKRCDQAIAALLDLEAQIEGAAASEWMADAGSDGSRKKTSAKGKAKRSRRGKSAKSKEIAPEAKESASAPLMAADASATAGARDNLELIAGVGPKLAVTLNEIGIRSFSQIAEWTEEDVRRMDEYLSFQGRIARENWIGQAKALAAGGREEYMRTFGREPR